MDEIALVEYDPRWPEQFAQETARVRAALGDDSVTAIEHFGSTSVPGLAAKPVLDIDVVVERPQMAPAIAALEAVGYVSLGDKPWVAVAAVVLALALWRAGWRPTMPHRRRRSLPV